MDEEMKTEIFVRIIIVYIINSKEQGHRRTSIKIQK